MLRLPPLLLIAGFTASPASAGAQSASAPPATEPSTLSGDTIRLTDEERKAIADTTTVESAAAARGEMTGSARSALEVHGEVGAVIGSNGTRAVYGTAAIPLGDHAGAVVSVESSRSVYRR